MEKEVEGVKEEQRGKETEESKVKLEEKEDKMIGGSGILKRRAIRSSWKWKLKRKWKQR